MKQERPANPYRRREASDGSMSWGELSMGTAGEMPRRHDTETGPGLVAADIDRIARDHYRDGYAAGRWSREGEAVATQQALAEAFDEGATAQDGLNTALVWRSVHQRLMSEIHFPLMRVEHGTKSKREENLAKLRELVDEFLRDARLSADGGPPLD